MYNMLSGTKIKIIIMDEYSEKCTICEEGTLHSQRGTNIVEYKGQEAQLEMYFSVCGVCGSEQTDELQMSLNKRAVLSFKKRIEEGIRTA